MRAAASHRNLRAGFSLVEVVVAMAILVTVLSSVVLLYNGAVRTTLQGYANIDNREIGRTVLNAIERDMETAFTAREYGKFYQFHGTPNGFSYVGVLPDGKLGRVTYAMNRLDDKYDYQTEFVIGFRLLLERAIQQKSVGATNPPQAGIDFARLLVEALILDTTLPPEALEAFDNAVIQGQADLLAAFNSGAPLFWKLGSLTANNGAEYENYPVEMIVNVETTYMVRLEEPGVSDLTSFDLPPNALNPGARMQFPLIDPNDIDFIDPVSFQREQSWYGGNCVYISGNVEQTSGYAQDLLWCTLYNALLSPEPGQLEDLDLRALLDGTSFALNDNTPSYFITGETVGQILEARKRDLWISMLAGEDFLGLMSEDENLIPLLFSNGGNLNARNWFEAWRLDDGERAPNDPAYLELIANNRDPFDYVVGERIVSAARPQLFDAGNLTFSEEVATFDVMGVGEFFIYGDTDEEFKGTYNTPADIPGYPDFVDPTFSLDPNATNPPPATTAERFEYFDRQLGEEIRGIRTRASTGSPITPRLPKMISPRFWVMTEGRTPGSPDFKEYFDQVVEVPSGAGRRVPTQFIANSN